MHILTLALLAGIAQAEPMTEEASAELVQSLELPTQANNYRMTGADEAQTKVAIQAMEEAKVPASQAAEAVGAAAKDAEETGPTDDFGAFVQTQLAEGKRGKDLSDAIHAEHLTNGKGKGKGKGEGHGHSHDHDHGEGHGSGEGGGNKGGGASKGGGHGEGGASKGGGHGEGGGNKGGGVSKGGGHGEGGGNKGGGVSKGDGEGSKGGGNTGGGVSKGGGKGGGVSKGGGQ